MLWVFDTDNGRATGKWIACANGFHACPYIFYTRSGDPESDRIGVHCKRY